MPNNWITASLGKVIFSLQGPPSLKLDSSSSYPTVSFYDGKSNQTRLNEEERAQEKQLRQPAVF